MAQCMGHTPRARYVGFRRAVAASIALHVVLAAAIVVQMRQSTEKAAQPGIDTRASETTIRLTDEDVRVAIADPPALQPIPEPPAIQQQTARKPFTTTVPNSLTAELLSIVRRQTTQQNPMNDPNVKPAGATTQSLSEKPLHGAMKPGQSIVYVLDCSGSMGEYGKLAAARDALIATLRRQPADVRFQVIAYNGRARSLLLGGCVTASVANVTAAEEKLAELDATGRSNHAEAVRLAASLHPDVIVLLTDADELSSAQFKAAFAGRKVVPVCIAAVTAEGVEAPRELR
jgi:von Willebrand factor type A domain